LQSNHVNLGQFCSIMINPYEHIPVLLNEVLEYLSPRPGQNIVDATLGGGGYTSAIINKIKPDGKVLAIDLDKDAVENFKLQITNFKKQVIVTQGNFSKIDNIIKNHNFPGPDGIVADLGLSSYELEHRGMSFQKDQPLDMRFNQSQPEDAKFILNNYEESKLREIFEKYGEEKFSRQIARKILDYRLKIEEIKHTGQLYKIIQDALPKPVKHKADDSARRIFQALRIEVNYELQSLEEFLPKAFDLLVPGGRLVVVSFHSLEDRIVKQFFVGLTKGCVCPPDFPQCICGKNPKGKILTKKPITATEAELKNNSRSAPAKLRAIEKL
jgi:16S rRNA (cytosine1402-N4)-methyltransferase